MKQLHKKHLIIIWCSVIALSLLSLFGLGATLNGLLGITTLVGAGIVSTIGYVAPLDDVKKSSASGLSTSDRNSDLCGFDRWQFHRLHCQLRAACHDNFLFY